MSRKLLQIRVHEVSKCSRMKISNFQSVICENLQELAKRTGVLVLRFGVYLWHHGKPIFAC